MLTGLRVTFWVHTLVALVMGLLLIFAPGWTMNAWGSELLDEPLVELYGAAIVGLGVASLLAALARRWEEVRITAYMEVTYTAVASLLGVYLMFFSDAVLPTLTWLLVVMYALFFIAFGYFTLAERTRPHEVESGTPAFR
jgi:O-antigen/teichoic acid export membrane protein